MKIGELMIDMAADVARLRADMNQATTLVGQAARQMQSAIDSVKGALAGMAAAFVAGFSINALKNMIAGTVEAGERLHDLSIITNTSVEALSALASVGKFSGQSAESIAGAMNKLARNLASTTEESKGAGLAIQAIGLSVSDFQRLNPEQQMLAVAGALNNFTDSADKSAVMMALYGKSGAELLPMMKDLATTHQYSAKITAEQAAAADNLSDNWLRLKTSGEAWKKELALAMIPALDQGVQALLGVTNGSGGLRAEIKRLAADGSIREWTTNAITDASYVVEAFEYAVKAIRSAGLTLASMVGSSLETIDAMKRGWAKLSSGDIGGVLDEAAKNRSREARVKEDLGKSLAEIWDAPTKASKFREAFAAIQQGASGAAGAGEKAKQALNFSNTIDKNAKSAKDSLGAYDAMFKHFAEQRNAMVEELALGREQTASEKERTKVITDLGQIEAKIRREGGADMPRKLAELETRKKQADGELLLNEALRQQLDVQRSLIKHAEELAKARQAYRQSEEGAIRGFLQEQDAATHAALQGVADRVRSLDEENAALGLTQAKNISLAEAVERVTIARLKDQQASKFWEGSEGWKNLQAEIDAREKLAEKIGSSEAAKKELESWRSTWQSIDSAAHDAFVSIFDKGSDVFQRLGQSLKTGLLDMLYQLTVRQWIIQIGASISGSGSVQGLMTGFNSPGGGILGMASNGSSLWSGAGNIGSALFGNSMAYGAAVPGLSMGSQQAAMLAAQTGEFGFAGLNATSAAGASASGAGMGAMGALGAVAWIGAIAALANTPASPHTGGASTAGAAVKPADLKAAFDGIDAKTQANLDKLTGSSTALLNFFSKLSGGQGGYSVSANYAADGRDAASGNLVITKLGQILSDWEASRKAGQVSARDFAMGDYGSLLTAQTDSGEAAGMADAGPKIAAMVEDQWAQYLEAVKGDLMAQMQASGADIPAWARKMLAPLADVSAEDFSTELDKITKKIIALPETIAQQIGYNRDTVVNAWVDGLRTGDATAAGIKAADTFVSGIETQMLTSAAGKIQDIVFSGAIVPIVDSLMQGATLSQALAEANLDEVIKKAQAQAQAFAAVWGNADFQAALASIHDGYAKVMGDLGTTLNYTPVYTQSTQAAAAAQSDLAAAQSEATRAAEQEAQRLADLHKSLTSDLASLDIELLRRSGQSAAADAAARAKATEGYDAEALALYDLIAARRAHIADLDAEASRAQQLDGLYAGIYAKIATPAERMAYGYERIAASLQNAGLYAGQTDLSSILAEASMPQVRDTVQKLWGESSSQTRLALLDAVGALADLKTEAASLADQAEQTALNLATQNANAAFAIVQRAIDAEKKAGQERLRLAQTEETRLKSLVDYLHGQALDLYGQTDSTAQWMAAQGQAYIDAALAGGALDRDKLGEAVSAIRATLKPDLFGSAKDMEFQTLVLAGKLSTLEQSTGRQLTAAQRALKAEEDVAKALDELAQTQRDALDMARGTYAGILGIQDAIQQLSAAILAEKAISGIMQGSIAGSTYAPKTDTLHSAVTGLDYSGASIGGYLKALNAAGDNAGALDAYEQLTANGATSAMVSKLTGWSLDQINTWVDANNLPRFDVGTNYVPRDMLAMVHEGEAIVPRAYNPAAGGGSNSDSEVRALRAEVAALRAELSSILGSIAASSARTADLTDRYTEGGNAARVVAPEPLQVTTA